MPFSELEFKRIEKRVDAFIETRRPPPAIRDQIDLGFRLQDQSVELFEIRPVWDKPEQKQEYPFAKATYVKTKNIWKVYWMRADLKWHSYPATPTVKTLDAFLAVVAEDKHACFFG